MKTFICLGKPRCPASGTFAVEYVSLAGHSHSSPWVIIWLVSRLPLLRGAVTRPKPASYTLGNFVGRNSGASRA